MLIWTLQSATTVPTDNSAHMAMIPPTPCTTHANMLELHFWLVATHKFKQRVVKSQACCQHLMRAESQTNFMDSLSYWESEASRPTTAECQCFLLQYSWSLLSLQSSSQILLRLPGSLNTVPLKWVVCSAKEPHTEQLGLQMQSQFPKGDNLDACIVSRRDKGAVTATSMVMHATK